MKFPIKKSIMESRSIHLDTEGNRIYNKPMLSFILNKVYCDSCIPLKSKSAEHVLT